MTLLAEANMLSTRELSQVGQSPWLDFISRDLIRSGRLKDLIDEKGLLGVTSNPAIFQKAISTRGAGYDKDIQRFYKKGFSTFEVYDALTVADIQAACDAFKKVFQTSNGEHGFVSLEVDPGLAYDLEKTVREALRLFKLVNRENVMIKVPATPEGVEAVRALIGLGVNINVTLMFSLKHYQDVAWAYVKGLEDFAKKGGDVSKVHSVSSVFVSRLDSFVDKRLSVLAQDRPNLIDYQGKAAVANCKVIYSEFQKIFGSSQFQKLEKKGAWIQKVLWGSTSVKNPDYHDLLYVEPLVGPETVNTLPQPTFEALLDHGVVRSGTIMEDVEEAKATLKALKGLGFDFDAIGNDLQAVGAQQFCDAFDVLMKTLEDQRMKTIKVSGSTKPAANKVAAKWLNLPAIKKSFARANKEKFIERLMKKDPSLWKSDLESQKVITNRLGWLTSPEWILGKMQEVDRLDAELKKDKIKTVVLLGMGGSSLAPEVFDLVCKNRTGQKRKFYVMDTTDPSTLLAVEKKIQLKSTVFIVSSKSGGTVETISQFRYFLEKVRKSYKASKNKERLVGSHFIAITDQGSMLQDLGAELSFRRVLVNPTDIGGRYSALSYFGLVPAALIGIPVRDVLTKVLKFLEATEDTQAVEKNPGVGLGVLLGELANQGKNKLTLWTSPSLAPVGAWLEQLIAESTGKEGEGILPIDGESFLKPEAYADDRVFAVLKLKGENSKKLQEAVKQAKKSGFPVIETEWSDESVIGAEFLRWEIATSIASAVMGVNPFDEPNVKESKELTGQFLKELEKKVKLALPKNLQKVPPRYPGTSKDQTAMHAWLEDVAFSKENLGYVAFLCYIPRTKPIAQELTKIQKKLAEGLGMPVAIGFGPRYLHSIGQLYKGGPRNGVFVELIMDESIDPKVPGASYRFGELKRAQAFGDLAALNNKNLPSYTFQLGKKPLEAIKRLSQFISAYFQK